MYPYVLRPFFFKSSFSFPLLKLLWNFHSPDNMFMCINMMKEKKGVLLLTGGSEICGCSGDLLWSLNPGLEEIPLPRFTSPRCWLAVLLVQVSGCPGERDHISSAMLGSLWGWWEPTVQDLSCMLPLQRGSLERVVMVWGVHSNSCYSVDYYKHCFPLEQKYLFPLFCTIPWKQTK